MRCCRRTGGLRLCKVRTEAATTALLVQAYMRAGKLEGGRDRKWEALLKVGLDEANRWAEIGLGMSRRVVACTMLLGGGKVRQASAA